MIIQRDQSLTNSNMRNRPFTNDHPEGSASCKRLSRGSGLLQVINHHPRHPRHLCLDPDLISRIFLEQFVLVNSSWVARKTLILINQSILIAGKKLIDGLISQLCLQDGHLFSLTEEQETDKMEVYINVYTYK